MEVGRVDNALAAAGGLGMHRHLVAGVRDANLPAQTTTRTLSPISRHGTL